MRSHIGAGLLIGLIGSVPVAAGAGEAAVLDATARANPDGTYAISATIAHADTGWEHYANKWEVVGPNGQVLDTRTLFHPHVGEQPFTRSLARVEIPIGVTEVIIRAYDSVHEDGPRTFTLKLPPRK